MSAASPARRNRRRQELRTPKSIFPAVEEPGEIFGENVFTVAVMRKPAQAGLQVDFGHD